MKSLRKSLNANRDPPRPQISTPLPLPAVSKPPSAILPPQKVIRALNSHRSQAPQELSFQKGDFFYVINDADGRGQWYEAHNPVTGARGLVPRHMFEEFNKNANSRASQFGLGSSKPPARPVQPTLGQKSQVFFAVVQHDFEAERPDELGAKRGDAVTVVAQSNREWLVAKPIGRLGRPGLIPVSFVEIHDPATGKPVENIDALMDKGDLPKVEDWKKAMLNYKQNSIPLGVIEPAGKGITSEVPFTPVATSPTQQSFRPFSATDPPRPPTPQLLPDGLLLSADVVSFHFEMDEYWFRINALYQPYQRPEDYQFPPAKQLILFRVYNDFYDFQVALLDAFPREGGRHPPHPRILPFMPGPAEEVDDALTATRRAELDTYVHGLCDLANGARYILENYIVREFLSLKPGDVENEVEPHGEELDALLDGEASTLHDDSTVVDDGYDREIRDKMGGLRVTGAASDYDADPYNYNQSSIPPYELEPRSNSRNGRLPSGDAGTKKQFYSQSHGRTNSSSSFDSRNQSPYLDRSHNRSPQPSRNGSQTPSQSRYDKPYNTGPPPTTISLRLSQNASSRSRSTSNVTSNLNNPPISAANPQTAFVKVKIFDRVADDLIAIRVHPRVTHVELMEKVQARLGGEITILRYRDSMSNTFVGLGNDQDLRVWMEGTDKHVLYAD